MKHCKRCERTLPEEMFSKRGHGLQSWCKVCMNSLARKNYTENAGRYKIGARVRDADLDVLIVREKYKPCTDCGVIYPPYVMQFDHTGGKKILDISKMRRRRMAFSAVIEEMKKCEVVCANCHAERTHGRQPSPRLAKAVDHISNGEF